uniref:Uncharacterized protein n=1 Tax=Octopus bimaculoides TaxID=37653 RepID=A0A0L8GAL2_OCTBM
MILCTSWHETLNEYQRSNWSKPKMILKCIPKLTMLLIVWEVIIVLTKQKQHSYVSFLRLERKKKREKETKF